MTEQQRQVTTETVADPGRVLLRGKIWEIVDVKWNPSEPDVGIMSEYVGEFDLQDAEGIRWDWQSTQLTDAEDEVVNAALCKLDYEPPEPPDPDGECFRGGEAASAVAEEQAWVQRNLK